MMRSDVAAFYVLKNSVMRILDKEDIRVISFDVFDTLLHRRCDPDAVLDGVASWLDAKIDEMGLQRKRNAADARHIAYGIVAENNVENGFDCDTTISDFAPVWIDELCIECDEHLKNDLVHNVVRKETELELHACYENVYTHELIRDLKAKGYRIVYTSDMYLGRKIVGKLLDENGYEGFFDDGYVSGDIKLLKRTGRLFQHVLDAEGVSASNMLHIGDNYKADCLEAKKRGISAIHINDKKLVDKRNSNLFDYKVSKINPTWKGAAIASYATSSPVVIGNYLEVYGKRVFGPIFSTFVHKVLERCVEEKIERVYFLSREGFLLEEVAKKFYHIIPNINTVKEIKYLYVSRLVTYLACMRTVGLREIRSVYENAGGYLTIRTLFSPLKLDKTFVEMLATRHGLDADDVLPEYYLSWSPFINLVNDFELQEIVDEKSASAKGLLEKYLEQEGFFSCKRVAIVDVGWGGQIQENLYQAMQHRADIPQIFGIYMATNVKAHSRKTPRNWMEWVLADQSHLKWCGNAAFDYVQSLEAISRAPHATVIGYEKDSQNTIVPLLKSENETSRQAELLDDLNISVIQKGILDYADSYSYGIQIYSANAQDTLNYAATALEYGLRYPSKKEAEALLQLKNASDLGSNDVFDLGDHNGKSYFSLNKIKNAVRASFWPYGTLAYAYGKPAQITYFMRKVLKLTPTETAGLAPGMVWTSPEILEHKVDTRNEKVTFSVNDEVVKQHNRNYQIGKNRHNVVLACKYDKPIRGSHVLVSFGTYKIANFIMKRFTNKHQYTYDGLSAKYSLYRAIYLIVRPTIIWQLVKKVSK
jgi:predicted HAD superfamily hydrolase